MMDERLTAEPLPPRPRFEMLDGGGLRVAAPAKINLDLLVGPRRPDGFHTLDSLVAKVTLYDEIVLRPRPDGRLALICGGADCGPAADNLALRAARRLADAAGEAARGADVVLSKRIPPGAGLGGGSSDAAAVLAGLNEMWAVGLDPRRLAELGAELGSDVPLFLGPPACRMTGRGERIEPVAVRPFLAVLHLPPLACPTGEVYRAFDEGLPGAAPRGPRADLPLDRESPSRWRDRLRNDLAGPAMAVRPELRTVYKALDAAVARPVHVTGSGSGLFVLCDDADEAGDVLRRLPADLPGHMAVVTLNPW